MAKKLLVPNSQVVGGWTPAFWRCSQKREFYFRVGQINTNCKWLASVTECSCNSGVLGGAPRSSLPGEFQNLRRQQKR